MQMDKITENKIKEENRKLHNFSAGSYDNYPPYILKQQNRMYRKDLNGIKFYLGKRKNIRVLDCGCGTGILANKLCKQGFEVHCLDISKEMIKITLNKLGGKCKYFLSDIDCYLETLHEYKYDVICFTSVLHHIGDYYKTLDLAISKLKKGGIIYIADEPQAGERTSTIIIQLIQFLGNMYINMRRAYKNPKHAINFIKNKFKKDENNIDVGLAEYHATLGGIKEDELIGYFFKKNFMVLFSKHYLMNALKFMDRFNFLYKGQPKTFRMVVKKK